MDTSNQLKGIGITLVWKEAWSEQHQQNMSDQMPLITITDSSEQPSAEKCIKKLSEEEESVPPTNSRQRRTSRWAKQILCNGGRILVSCEIIFVFVFSGLTWSLTWCLILAVLSVAGTWGVCRTGSRASPPRPSAAGPTPALERTSRQMLTMRFNIKWKNGGQIHETWHIHKDGYFQTNFSFLQFSSKFLTATLHKHPCRTFVLVFGMTLEIKIWEKPFLSFTNFPWKLSL